MPVAAKRGFDHREKEEGGVENIETGFGVSK
jgi:hypothetical protein